MSHRADNLARDVRCFFSEQLQERIVSVERVSLEAERSRRSLVDFNCYTHTRANGQTETDYSPQFFHRNICRDLMAVEAGKISKLLINVPPGHGKTINVLVQFAAWAMGRRPALRIGAFSHRADFVDQCGAWTRNLVNSRAYKAVFPDVRIIRSREGYWTTSAGGFYMAEGVLGGGMGERLDLLLIDDAIKGADQVRSRTQRDHLEEWYQTTALTRLEPTASQVLIMHRWHHDDLAARVLKRKDWVVAKYPAIKNGKPIQDDPRKEGEALWPSRFSLKWLAAKREEIGPRAWSALYQQEPVAEGGVIFQSEWWKYYEGMPRDAFRMVVQSWDSAFKKGRDNDYSVCTTWGCLNGGYHLLDLYRARVHYPELKRMVLAQYAKHQPSVVLIEDAASGQSLVQDLKLTHLPVIAVKPGTDKVSRATPVTGTIAAGKVFLPEGAPWLSDFLVEHGQFPNGEHDDQVDSMVQALDWLRRHDYSQSGPLMERI